MLSGGQRCKGTIIIARPQKPSLKDGFCGLGGHAATVTPLASRMVRSV
jgi:hypothetical protein